MNQEEIPVMKLPLRSGVHQLINVAIRLRSYASRLTRAEMTDVSLSPHASTRTYDFQAVHEVGTLKEFKLGTPCVQEINHVNIMVLACE
jgi:hypothetical protein